MTLATSCPACGTVFKIVEDQLKVSEGWVRCGHCQDVFNALEGLFDLAGRERPPLGGTPSPAQTARTVAGTASHGLNVGLNHGLGRSGARASSGVSTRSALGPEPEGAQSATGERPDSRRGSIWDLAAARQHEQQRQAAWQARPPQGQTDAPSASPSGPSAEAPAARLDPTSESSAGPGAETPPARRGEPRPSAGGFAAARAESEVPDDGVDLSEADTVFLAHDPNASFEDPFDSVSPARPLSAEDDPADGRWRSEVEAGPPDPVTAAATAARLAESMAAVEPMPPLPTFVRQADRAARWRRPGMRFALGLGCLFAVGAMAGQVLLHHRDGAAARWPVLRTPLASLCAPLDCVVQAPRQLDALVVESTALTRPAGVDGYRLQLLLRNHAEFAVLAPHVELSLTDAGGAIVVRRVISPTEFRQPATLAANSEGNWQLELTSSDKRVAGYTVAVFYP